MLLLKARQRTNHEDDPIVDKSWRHKYIIIYSHIDQNKCVLKIALDLRLQCVMRSFSCFLFLASAQGWCERYKHFTRTFHSLAHLHTHIIIMLSYDMMWWGEMAHTMARIQKFPFNTHYAIRSPHSCLLSSFWFCIVILQTSIIYRQKFLRINIETMRLFHEPAMLKRLNDSSV